MKSKSLIKTIINYFAIIVIVTFISMILLDIALSLYFFKDNSNYMREKHTENIKKLIKDEVMSVVSIINVTRENILINSKNIVKTQTYQAHSIAMSIYEKYKDQKSIDEIKDIIKNAISPMRYNNGKGYFFMTYLDGLAFIFADRPQLEGTNIIEMRDSEGRYVVKDIIAIAQKDKEGFYEYTWTKPYQKGDNFKKISYIKLIEPLGMFVGTGLYYDDLIEETQNSILGTISAIRFAKEGYIFINKFDGTSLINNGKVLNNNKKLWEEFPQHADLLKNIFQLELEASKKIDGNFIRYKWEKLNNPEKIADKISYIYGIQDWEWIVGAGLYLDDIEEEIAQLKNKMEQNSIKKAIILSLFGLILILFIRFLQNRFAKLYYEDYLIFRDTLKNILKEHSTINTENMKFSEFYEISEYTNEMVKSLKDSEKKFRDLFEKAHIPFAILNREFKYIDCNMAAIKFLNGETKDDILLSAGDLSPQFQPDGTLSKEKAYQLVRRVFETGESLISFEWTFKKFTGEIFSGLVTLSSIFYEGEDAVLVTWTDTSQIKELQNIVDTEKENLQITLNSINNGVIKLDKDLNVQLMNPVAEKLTGWSIKDAKDQPLQNILNLFDLNYKKLNLDISLDSLDKYRQANTFKNNILISKDKKESNVECTISLTKDDNGIPSGAILTLIDITDKLKNERELNKIEKLRSLGVLAGGIAHDFNNLLTSIYGYISLSKSMLPEDSKVHTLISKAEQSIDNAAKLTKQLLTFSKGGEPILENVDIKILIKETVKFNLSGKNIKPIFDIDENLYTIDADKGQLSQVLSNLTINAVQAMKDGGSIHIKVSNSENPTPELYGTFIKIVFRDEGTGIPPSIIDKIFDPYFTTKSSGTGLGLSVVYSIVTRHKGKIYVNSTINEGTEFTIYLPASKRPLPEPPITGELALIKKGIDKKQSLKILLLDDQEDVLDVLQSIIETLSNKVEGYTRSQDAVIAYSKALENKDKFDIVILDLTLPGDISGKDVIKKLIEIDPDVRGIVSSGYSNDEVIANYEKYGFKGKLEKPYLMKQIQDEINRVMNL